VNLRIAIARSNGLLGLLGLASLCEPACSNSSVPQRDSSSAGTSQAPMPGPAGATKGTLESAALGGKTGVNSTDSRTITGGTSGGSTGSTSTIAGNVTCMAGEFLSSIGKNHLIVGASMHDTTANLAPFDGRYQYIAGGFFDGPEPCASCASGCTSNGASCASTNTAGCGWWGCWQWDQEPPGQYIPKFLAITDSATFDGHANPQILMFSYYQLLPASGVTVGVAEVPALNNQPLLHRYFADFRLVLQKIGSHLALLHIEPDLWGYVEHSGSDPHLIPAPVAGANPMDCPNFENSVAGMSRCLVSMVRKYAPNAKVGLHASGWGTITNVLANTDPQLDIAAEATKLGKYLIALGASECDFVAADMIDRDAGFYQKQGLNTWWDATNVSLPNFHQAFAWAKAVSVTVGRPIVWWQIPVGNMLQNDTPLHYRDNRVDYLMAHLDEVVAANGAGLFFGAGELQQTAPETDGGNLLAKVKAYSASPVSPCP